ASASSSPTTTCARRWPSPIARTSCTTARSWWPAPPPRSPTTPWPGRSTWASGSRSRRGEDSHGHGGAPLVTPESAGRHDAAAAAGDPALAAVHARAPGRRPEGAPRESATRRGHAGDGRGTADTAPAPTVAQLSTEAPPPSEGQTDELPFDFNAVISHDDDHEERSLVSQEDREDLPFENVVRNQVSLTDHLDEQLRFAAEDPVVRRIGTEIIGNLDEDGYLRAELEELAQRCSVTAEEVGKVLILVQGFDPPGVAARNIQECLLLQLRRDPLPDPVSIEIIEVHFDDLSRRRYTDIARAMKLS